MKMKRFFRGFFMLLAMLMLAMVGGEPLKGGGDAAHVLIVVGMAVVIALSFLIVAWLSPEKKFYARSGGK